MSNISIWPKNVTESGATIPDQNWTGSNGNEGVLGIRQSSSITGASPSDCLMLYQRHLLVRVGLSYSSAEM